MCVPSIIATTFGKPDIPLIMVMLYNTDSSVGKHTSRGMIISIYVFRNM